MDDESSRAYTIRLMKIVTDHYGYGLGFQKMWKYYPVGSRKSKDRTGAMVKLSGYEKNWRIAVAKLAYYEGIGI